MYYEIFSKIRLLIIILGLWAPSNNTCWSWFLRKIYPIIVYFIILYPWTQLIIGVSYSSIPVFLFITLHISGWVSYYTARKYWNKYEHFYEFITSSFIPYFDDIDEFDDNYDIKDTFGVNHHDDEAVRNRDSNEDIPHTLKDGFLRRYKRDNAKRKLAAERKFHVNKLNSIDSSTLADIEFSTNKLSMTLFYEGVQRLRYRFWLLSAIVAIPTITILLLQLFINSWNSPIIFTSSNEILIL